MGPMALLGVLAALLVVVYLVTGGGSGVEVDPSGEPDRVPTVVKITGVDPARPDLATEDPEEALLMPPARPPPAGPAVAPADRPDPNLVTNYSQPDANDIATLEAILQDQPNDVELVSIVAHRYYQGRRLDDALTLYAHGLKLQPDHANMLFYQGGCYYLKGWVPRARENWEKVARIDAAGKLGKKARKRLEQIEQTVARK